MLTITTMKTNDNFDNLTKQYSVGRLSKMKYNSEGKPVLSYPARTRKFRPHRMSLQDIIRERLKLQSTVRSIESEFGIESPTFDKVTSEYVVYTYINWPREKQTRFLELLGGVANKGRTARMLTDLHKQYSEDVPF